MIRKLQWRFIGIAILSVFLVLVILIGAINVLNYSSVVTDADGTLTMLAENGGRFPGFSGKNYTPPREGDARNSSDDSSRRLYGNRDRRELSAELPFQSRYFTAIIDEDGTVGSLNVENIAALDESEASALALSVFAKGRGRGFADGYRYRRTEMDGGTMLIFLSCHRELATVQTFLLVSGIISAAGLTAVFLLIVLFSRRIVRPIAESYEKQKRFITEAGHELKTPLTIINADADVLEMDLEQPSEWLDDIRTQTQRLTVLTNDLIYLSRMEEDVPVQMIEFPLTDVVSEMAQSFFAVAKSQNKTFDVSLQPMLTLSGDEKAIRKCVSVLLDNALKYSPEGGVIRLRLQKEGKQIRLSVYNTAEQVQKGNADRLFDRFYRADASRNSAAGGFGLGLSVAKAVVEAHKGKIHAFSEDGASLTIEASLPQN